MENMYCKGDFFVYLVANLVYGNFCLHCYYFGAWRLLFWCMGIFVYIVTILVHGDYYFGVWGFTDIFRMLF
jgi:hypothetical protein